MFDGEAQRVGWGGFLNEFPPLYGGQENPTGPEQGRGKPGEGWGPPQVLHSMHRGMGKMTCHRGRGTSGQGRHHGIFGLLIHIHSPFKEAETVCSTPGLPDT